MLTVLKRELHAYFFSPLAYVVSAIFIAIFSMRFVQVIMNPMNFFYGYFLYYFAFWLAFIIPVLTMRTFAEERKSGTEVLLMTSPLNVIDIVIGKFLAAFIVFLAMTALTLIFPIVIAVSGKLVLIQTISSYAGFILIGAAFTAFGVFASSLTENQIIAAVIGIVGIFMIWLVDNIKEGFRTLLGGIVYRFADWISLFDRFDPFRMGLIELKDIVFFFSLVGVLIALTMIIIEKRRWSQG